MQTWLSEQIEDKETIIAKRVFEEYGEAGEAAPDYVNGPIEIFSQPMREVYSKLCRRAKVPMLVV